MRAAQRGVGGGARDALVLLAEERVCGAGGACTTCAADAVHVILDRKRKAAQMATVASARGLIQGAPRMDEPIVDHALDARDVQAARRNIRGDEQWRGPSLERRDSLRALPLWHVALDLFCAPAAAAQPLAHTCRLKRGDARSGKSQTTT